MLMLHRIGLMKPHLQAATFDTHYISDQKLIELALSGIFGLDSMNLCHL